MNPLSTFRKVESRMKKQRYLLQNIASNINPKTFMKLGIISDIHDKVDILRKALDILQKTDALICCGDLCSPFVIRELGTHYNKEIHLVLGNNDADIFRITQNSQSFPQIKMYPEMGDITLANKRIGFIHYDNLARPIIASGWYDIFCFGHNHQYEIGIEGKTRFINPGELSGVLTGKSTCAILDTEDGLPENPIIF